jgi:cell division protein FtsL
MSEAESTAETIAGRTSGRTSGRPARRRLPGWLRPRDHELPGSGRTRLVETTLLLLAGLLLAVATVNDVVRQTHVNQRLIADLRTWRTYTGHDYHNLSVDQKLLGEASQHEVICGNTSPGAPKARTQLCLAVWGPIVNGRRTVQGGWYLPAKAEDERVDRYGCFGAGSRGMCPR